MAKHRKTREQKQLADLRHNFQHQIVTNTFEVKLPSTKISPKIVTNSYTSYPYLVKDLSKTFVLTAFIVAFQVALFFILKTHLIKIPGILY